MVGGTAKLEHVHWTKQKGHATSNVQFYLRYQKTWVGLYSCILSLSHVICKQQGKNRTHDLSITIHEPYAHSLTIQLSLLLGAQLHHSQIYSFSRKWESGLFIEVSQERALPRLPDFSMIHPVLENQRRACLTASLPVVRPILRRWLVPSRFRAA